MAPLSRQEVDELLRSPFTYQQRPRPAPADGRPVWRVPYVLLLVRACRSQAASLQQLHVLNWALRSTHGADQLGRFLAGDLDAEQPVVRYEPALDRAVALAGGLGLLTFDRKLWRLNDAGKELVANLDEDTSLFADEKQRLAVVGAPLTQSAVSGLLRREPTAA